MSEQSKIETNFQKKNIKEDFKKEEFTSFKTGAHKDLKGKLRLDLVPPEMDIPMALGLQAGIDKGHKENDWQLGIPYEQNLAAAKRHIMKYRLGQDYDIETGIHHIALAITNLGMVWTQIQRGRTDLDDRIKYNNILSIFYAESNSDSEPESICENLQDINWNDWQAEDEKELNKSHKEMCEKWSEEIHKFDGESG